MVSSGHGNDSEARGRDISAAGYRQLAEFRYRIRRFLHFSEEAARSNGIEPQQHQLLLAIKGLPEGTPAQRSCAFGTALSSPSQHGGTDRPAGRAKGGSAPAQRSRIAAKYLIELTPHGEELLHRLSVLHRQELRVSGPALSEVAVQRCWPTRRESERGRHDIITATPGGINRRLKELGDFTTTIRVVPSR